MFLGFSRFAAVFLGFSRFAAVFLGFSRFAAVFLGLSCLAAMFFARAGAPPCSAAGARPDAMTRPRIKAPQQVLS